jgi:hypothetical protein
LPFGLPNLGSRKHAISVDFQHLGRLNDVVCVLSDSRPKLLVASLHFGVVSLHVFTGKPNELLVVGALEVVPAGAIDRAHV